MKWLNQAIAQTLPLVPRPVVRKVSARYIAGNCLDDAVRTVTELNAAGLMATLDVLGEFVTTEEEARRAAGEYLDALDAIERKQLDSNVSIKLTQMGLKLDVDLCFDITETVVRKAQSKGNFVRLDMEDATCTDDTLAVYRRLRERYPDHVGCVIQAYLKRSAADIDRIVQEGGNVRLCKGIYVESSRIAIKDPAGINRSYDALLRTLLEGGVYTGIATHDAALVDSADRLVRELKLDRSRYEFQMLLGVTEPLRAHVLGLGHRMRVYVPYGSHWYAYSIRRLKENPQIAGHILRNMFH